MLKEELMLMSNFVLWSYRSRFGFLNRWATRRFCKALKHYEEVDRPLLMRAEADRVWGKLLDIK